MSEPDVGSKIFWGRSLYYQIPGNDENLGPILHLHLHPK